MATTLATRKQSAAIRQKMQEIRSELPYDVDDARERIKQLSDWRYHMSRHAMPILVAVAVAGFLIVPRKRSPTSITVHHEPGAAPAAPAKRGLLGGIAGAALTMLLKQGASLAAHHFAGKVSRAYPNRIHPSQAGRTVP